MVAKSRKPAEAVAAPATKFVVYLPESCTPSVLADALKWCLALEWAAVKASDQDKKAFYSVQALGDASLPEGLNVFDKQAGYLENVQSKFRLYDANVSVSYLVSADMAPELKAKLSTLVEYENMVLKSILYQKDAPLADLLLPLEQALSNSSTFLSREHPWADIVLFAALYVKTMSETVPLTASIHGWFNNLSQQEWVIKALTQFKTATRTICGLAGEAKYRPDVRRVLTHHEKPVMPVDNQRNVLITSALPYVNNIPHLGNIIGCVLSADVFARYCRLQGYNTMFICGTDEYGTATETKAISEGLTCQQICDKYHKVHKECYEWFGVDFDFFGRTTTSEQTRIAQDIFLKAEKNGFTLEDTVTQLYCEKHSSFLADRFVEGTCPFCKYNDARGDQCDQCGKLLNATDLINPRCKLDNAVPVLRDSKHIFLDLSKLQDECEKSFKKASDEGKWSVNGINITNIWLKEGLKPRCITRDLKWGTPVPKVGFEDKVFYVWFDAPIGYPSITANYTPDWEKWWKNPDQVKLYEFMGKDNVPFHSVIFPSSLLATRDPWTPVHHINTTEYLQYEGTKFSKSRGVGVFGNNVMESGIPVEVWRYYLLSNRPETSDSQFTWDAFILANNGELLANLGNFVNRIVKFVIAKYESVVPLSSQVEAADEHMIKDVNALLKEYVNNMEWAKIRAALKLVMEVSFRGNAYLQENKIDNTLFASSRKRCDTVVYHALNLAYLLSALVYPFMPTTAESMCRQLNLPLRTLEQWGRNAEWKCNDILEGHSLGKAEYLFKMIDLKLADTMRAKYGGSQSSAPAETKPAKKASKSSSGPALLAEVPAGVAKTPEMESLEKTIKEQGDLVRKLKTEKAEAAQIKQAVDALLAAKQKLTQLVGK